MESNNSRKLAGRVRKMLKGRIVVACVPFGRINLRDI